MVKRPSREKQRQRSASGELTEAEKPCSKKSRRKASEDVTWILDTTLIIDDDDDDSTWVDDEEEEDNDYDEFLASLLKNN